MMLSTSLDYWSGLIIQRGGLRPREIVIPAVFLSTAAVALLGVDYAEALRLVRGSGPGGTAAHAAGALRRAGHTGFLGLVALVYRVLLGMAEEPRRKAAVVLSIVVQLSILGSFKYFNFFINSLVLSLNAAGIPAEASHFDSSCRSASRSTPSSR
jgi:hypothetical protein